MTTILCIDDDPELLELARRILERRGYMVLTTTDSRDALAILEDQPIDLIIQDFMRLNMNGFEFLKHMKSDERLRDIPVLALTAGSRELRGQQLKGYGLDIDRDLAGFIQKPYGPTELSDQVQAILSKRRDDAAS